MSQLKSMIFFKLTTANDLLTVHIFSSTKITPLGNLERGRECFVGLSLLLVYAKQYAFMMCTEYCVQVLN